MRSTPRNSTITVSGVTGTVPPNGPHNQPTSDPATWYPPQQPTGAFYLNQMAPPTPPRKPPSAWWAALIAIAVIAALSVGFAIFGGDEEAPATEPAGPTAAEAIAACQEAVKLRLKSPATAQFGGEQFAPAQDRGYPAKVTGHVDSQNGFGALVRNRYECLAHAGTSWRVSDVTFSDW